MLRTLDIEGRAATADEQRTLARWSGWGAIPYVFEDGADSEARVRLRELLGDDDAWAQARRTTLSAHYTSADVVQAMWRTAAALGFDGGRVLEPGCGSGNFLGFAPDSAELTGVECDRTTAAIATRLYAGRATIHARRFEEFDAPAGSFDLVIGNVPFAKVTPTDRRFNRGKHTLHNYFLIKSLHLVRPGGLVVALTSRFTLDARNPAARREMAGLADLVGAVRLPAGTFRESSGTEVVCDLLVLRRRADGEEPPGRAWTTAVPLDGTDNVWVNEVYVAAPEMVAGRLALTSGRYGDGELTVEPTEPLADLLPACLDRLVADARHCGLLLTSRPTGTTPQPPRRAGVLADTAPAHAQEGSFVLNSAGRFARLEDARLTPYKPRVASDGPELRSLIRLRDAARSTLAVQVDNGSDADLAAAQQTLRAAYDDYRDRYGPLNRYKLDRTGRRDPESGEEILRRTRPRMGGFRDDPDWPLVAALEVFDDESQAAAPAAIFTERIVNPPEVRHGVDTAVDAIAVCLDESGRVTLDRVADLLGIDREAARRELAGLVFDDPATGRLEPAARYLSGNIRRKIADVEAAVARGDDRYAENLPALREVLPRQLEPGEITARLGAPWIPVSDIEQFCADVLGVVVAVEHTPQLARWATALRSGYRGSVALTSEWGTGRADAVSLLEASLNQRLVTITDEIEGRKRVRNEAETIAAREKQDQLAQRFTAWVWEDPARATRLAARYNELFCSVRVPEHDGSHLSLPGLAATFTAHPHQRNAVARILTDGRALLAHAVGAGKTAVMVMAVMEQRRLGLARKPAVVVPNHMLEQFSREWLQLYPTARLLLADRDRLSRDRRKEFVARCATGEWDAVIFTQAGFARLPVGRDLLARYLGEQVERCREAVLASKQDKRISVKRLERRLAQMEQTYERLLAAHAKDDGIRFEETGIDYLYVDEAHGYKNRRVDSSIEGMTHEGSQRAQDLDAKLWVLRRRHGPRVVTFATATPVANSVAEMWTVQSYLQPDLLAEVNMEPFDAWAANFGTTVSSLELAPDGGSYRIKTRFSRFQNVPELMTTYRQVADVRTAEQLNLPVPALAGGKPETVVVAASDELRYYVRALVSRAEQIRNGGVAPEDDNMLKVSGDGRRAALDLRLVGQEPDPDGGKIRAAADRIATIYHETRELTYLDPLGQPARRPGALQLVFCDVSTPTGDGWNAYDELREQLAARGVPADLVRYVHEAASDEAKGKLFAACRDGRVAVLIGSTEKMGVGTNVQTRAVALHHLDCPWRPADLEQRDGRIVRQGNQNAEVRIIRYTTEGSFDIYMWQTVERKAVFIGQITSGQLADRDIDDIGDQALSYAEVKALATGNPLILEKAGVDADVAKLTRLARAHRDDQNRLRYALDDAERRATNADQLHASITDAIAQRTDTRGDRFVMTVAGARHTKRIDAGVHLKTAATTEMRTATNDASESVPIAELAGLRILVAVGRYHEETVRISVEGTNIVLRSLFDDWNNRDPAALVQGLERRIEHLETSLAEVAQDGAAARAEAERARNRIGQPFGHELQLHHLRRRQQEIAEALIETGDEPATLDSPIAVGETTPPRPNADSARVRLDRLCQPAADDALAIASGSSGHGLSL